MSSKQMYIEYIEGEGYLHAFLRRYKLKSLFLHSVFQNSSNNVHVIQSVPRAREKGEC